MIDTVERPITAVARTLIQSRLTEASRACARLNSGEDGEALHDFRVALRRTRSLIRASRPWLDPWIDGRARRGLRELAASTNRGRDIEVQREWLNAYTPARPAQAARQWLIEHLEEGLAGQTASVLEGLPERFAAIEQHLKGRGRRLDLSEVPSFAEVWRLQLRAECSAYMRALEQAAMEVEAVHAARIAGKRVRYLLEALRSVHPSTPELLNELKAGQELMGRVHDLEVFLTDLPRYAGEAAAESVQGAFADLLHADPALPPRLMHMAGLRVIGRALRTDYHQALDAFCHARPGLLALADRVVVMAETL